MTMNILIKVNANSRIEFSRILLIQAITLHIIIQIQFFLSSNAHEYTIMSHSLTVRCHGTIILLGMKLFNVHSNSRLTIAPGVTMLQTDYLIVILQVFPVSIPTFLVQMTTVIWLLSIHCNIHNLECTLFIVRLSIQIEIWAHIVSQTSHQLLHMMLHLKVVATQQIFQNHHIMIIKCQYRKFHIRNNQYYLIRLNKCTAIIWT